MDSNQPTGDQPEKEKYRTNLEKEFSKWGARLDELLGKADQATGDVKADIHKKVTHLKEKQNQMKEKLVLLKSDSGEAWDGLKTGVESAWGELKSGLNNAWDHLKPKSDETKPPEDKDKQS